MQIEVEEFFVVWNPEHGLPHHQHRTVDLARQEAERLARQHPGHRFIVMKSLCECSKDEIQWKAHGDEIPF